MLVKVGIQKAVDKLEKSSTSNTCMGKSVTLILLTGTLIKLAEV